MVTADDEGIGLSVVEAEGGIEITNTGETAVIVFVSSLDGEKQFEICVGWSVTVTGMTEIVDGSAATHLGTDA